MTIHTTSPTKPDTYCYVDGAWGGAETGAEETPYATIAAAIAASAAGDSILVAPGAYVEDLAWAAGEDINITALGGIVTITGATVITDATVIATGVAFIDDGAAGTDAIHFTGTGADTLSLFNCDVQSSALGLCAISQDNAAGTIIARDTTVGADVANANEAWQCEAGSIDGRNCDVLHASNVAEAFVAEGDAATPAILFVDCRFQGSVNAEAAVGAPTSFICEDCHFTVGAISAVIIAATTTIVLDGATIQSTDAGNDAIDGAGTLTIGKELKFTGAADEIATTLTVTHLLGSRIQHDMYTEAAGAGARAITFAQPFPTATVTVVCDGDWYASAVLATGFTLNTSGNATQGWVAIHD